MTLKSLLLVAAGFILLLLGAIGILIPVWPTTPFVLGSAACFAGTPRLRTILLRIGFFREYIENYQTRQGLSRKTVVSSLIFLWGMLLLSCLLVQRLWIIALLLAVGAVVTAHILWIARGRTKPTVPLNQQ